MGTATARSTVLQGVVFEDGLGKRHHYVAPGGEPLEVLHLRDEFSTDAFEHALRERVVVLAGFQKTCFGRIHGVQRSTQNGSKLFVVSDQVPGVRLSNVLAAAGQQLAPFGVNAKLSLIRELVTAIALLHEKLPGIAHGAISLERVVITPKARLVVTDHVLGSALEQLRFSPERYWKDLRIALPPGAQAALDQRADVVQIGAIALELILGRPIDGDEYPDRVEELTERAWRPTAAGVVDTPPVELQAWLLRMLQVDTKDAFASAVDAWADLERVLGPNPDVVSFDALQFFMAQYAGMTPADSVPTTVPVAVPPPPVRAPVAASLPPSPAPAPAAVTPLRPALVTSTAPPPAAPPQMSAEPSTAPPRPLAPPAVVRAAEATPTSAEPSITLHAAADAAADADANRTRRPMAGRRWLAAAAVLILLAGGGALFGRRYLVAPAAAEAPGTLLVSTTPAGVPVIVDGQPRGVTPLTVELAPGVHELRLAPEGGEPRIIPFTLTAGSTVAQTIELPKTAPVTGQLLIHSAPAGARVTIDGTPRGTTPLTVEGLMPGPHSVTLQSDVSSATQDVTIEPGMTASLVVPMTTAPGVPVSGWISVEAPAEVQVYEDTHLLGTSRTDRIMVLAGRHEFSIVNEPLGYRATRSVTVSPGKVSAIRLDWPNGSMALNAQPWADVWVDGERKGETPIGNISMPIGTHEVVFRHPELGERVVRATVTVATPVRVSVDMRKQ